MIKIPIRRITKRQVEWMAENRCRHGHTYLEHYACFVAEDPDTSPQHERIGIFDIETTGLKANWSHMLCWCIKTHNEDVIAEDTLGRKEVRDKNDKRIVNSLVEEIKKYDRLVTWYGSRFDVPYTRSRAMYHGIPFPGYRDLYHTDAYLFARSRFCLHSNRLGSVCEFFGIDAKNHPMSPELWLRAGRGDKDALDTILIHCREDVESTDAVFSMLLDHMILHKRSI